jgi:tetratricopeptide (TPR) repeat protein
MAGTILSALNKHEAETRKSKKRIQKSLDIYNTLLASSPHITVNTEGFIKAKIGLLHDALEDRDAERNIDEAVQNFQKTMAMEASIIELRKSAKTFYKEGLYVEALNNLKCLIQQNAADEFCVTMVVGCVLHLYAKNQLVERVDRFIAEAFQDPKKGALFKTMLADKMAKVGYAKHAAMFQ